MQEDSSIHSRTQLYTLQQLHGLQKQLHALQRTAQWTAKTVPYTAKQLHTLQITVPCTSKKQLHALQKTAPIQTRVHFCHNLIKDFLSLHT